MFDAKIEAKKNIRTKNHSRCLHKAYLIRCSTRVLWFCVDGALKVLQKQECLVRSSGRNLGKGLRLCWGDFAKTMKLVFQGLWFWNRGCDLGFSKYALIRSHSLVLSPIYNKSLSNSQSLLASSHIPS